MTQMLLFDTPASNAPSFPISSVSSAGETSAAVVGEDPHEGGVQRMGDLARLVLLRYELVARRRAARAAKKA